MKQVDDELKTTFWKDVWISDIPLRREEVVAGWRRRRISGRRAR